MGVELIIAAFATATGLASFITGVTRWLRRRESRSITIEIGGLKIEMPSNASAKDIEGMLEILRTDEVTAKKGEAPPAASSESGSVEVDILLLVVPGIIALLFSATFIYLLMANQNVPNYSTPKELTAAMTTIIGYYFGVGASTAANKSKTMSAKEVEKLLSSKRRPPASG